MIGRTVGNYIIRAKVGEGGMGAVYVAEHPHINRRVAIKVLHPGAERAPEMVHRFFNEARAATEIRNDHIVEVLDFGELPEKAPYLVMEWLEGQSLATLLRAETKLPPARAAHIVGGIARALKAAHGKGVVHRDLKPDNVFLVQREADADFVKVLDFGIAKLISSTGAPVRYQTQTGAIMGTPAYMSPEQCRGAKEIDHRTDIYSLGVIAYQMLTGRLPFAAESLGELLFKHLGEQAAAPVTLEPTLPPAVDAIVVRALDKAPDKRPTLAEIAAVMESIEGGAPLSGPVRVGTQPVGTPAAVASTPAAPVAVGSTTTLGGSASEIGLERQLGRSRRGFWLAVAAVALGGGGALAMTVATRHAAPGPTSGTAPVLTEAPAPAPPAPQPQPVQIEIRTVPETAALQIDDRPVGNPYLARVARDDRAHTVTAALPGFGLVHQALAFDRDRTLVLELVPVAAASSARPPATPGTPHHTGSRPGAEGAERPGKGGAKERGYRGSKLDIDTQFPAGSP